MEQAASLDEFVRAPVGRWVVAGEAVVWVHSPSLCGACGWGRPDAAATRATMRACDAFHQLAPRFSVILDGNLLEALLPEGIEVFLEWARRELAGLQQRIKQQISVIPQGVDGLTIAGMSPLLGHPYPVSLVTEPVDAFRQLLPEGGEAIAAEVAAIVTTVRGLPPALLRLRALLRARDARLPLAAAARELGLSERQLQRELAGAGSTFRTEVLDARFECLTRLLNTDDKITAIAARLGVTGNSLTALVRERTGQRPAEYRATLRRKP